MERCGWEGQAGATCCAYLETGDAHLAMEVGLGGGRPVVMVETRRMALEGSAQFSLPALGTSLESPQAMMLGERAGVRKGICGLYRAVWQEAQAL